MNHEPEQSEHLGLVVPTPSGKVVGKTFTHETLSLESLKVIGNALPDEAYSYRGIDGLKWTAIISTHGKEVVFINQWPGGSRSFRVLREHLV
jgi:hypothetical protein